MLEIKNYLSEIKSSLDRLSTLDTEESVNLKTEITQTEYTKKQVKKRTKNLRVAEPTSNSLCVIGKRGGKKAGEISDVIKTKNFPTLMKYNKSQI